MSGNAGGEAVVSSQRGRIIRAGAAEGLAIVTTEPVSFYGGVDLERGVVVEDGHPLEGQALAGRILVMPRGKGSTVGSWAMLRLSRRGLGPAAVLCARTETIVAVGAILAEIPCVDCLELGGYRTGDLLRVRDGLVDRLPRGADQGSSEKEGQP
jgi:predicted aconitase with swiveling domain